MYFSCAHTFFLLLLPVPFFYTYLNYGKFGIDKSMEWLIIPACLSLMCFFFFNRGNTEGTNSEKIVWLMFMFSVNLWVFFFVCVCG